jgi:CTP:molybdopterin cytidylyltransferase MocA
MGAFKPLLAWGGGTVVEACVDSLLEGGADEVVAVAGHRGQEVRAALRGRRRVRVVLNEDAGSEMGVSVARGVEAVGGEAGAVLVALADQPAVPASAVREVIDAWRRTGAPLVVPAHGGRGGHPVLVDLRFRAELLGLPEDRGLRALFDAHREETLRLHVASGYVVRDIDTWEEYTALHREVFGRTPLERGAD